MPFTAYFLYGDIESLASLISGLVAPPTSVSLMIFELFLHSQVNGHSKTIRLIGVDIPEILDDAEEGVVGCLEEKELTFQKEGAGGGIEMTATVVGIYEYRWGLVLKGRVVVAMTTKVLYV
ncbi:hypothetical protein ACFE04_023150 [Oxalis oulophora]